MEAFLEKRSRTTNQKVRSANFLKPPTPPARPASAPRSGDGPGSRTLARGLAVLDAVIDGPPAGVRLVDLAAATGLERATLYRLLAALIEGGHVARRGRFAYGLGPRLAALAPPGARQNLAVQLQPVLAEVSAGCGDAAFAIVREGGLSHCIARQVGSHPVQVLVIQVGTRQPLGVGAAGLALLAALPDAEVDEVIAANTPRLPAYGGMTPERLRLLVRATRERGWSVIGNHATRGVLAAGMAIRNPAGEPVAAISVASTLARMNKERQQLVVRLMRQAVQARWAGGA